MTIKVVPLDSLSELDIIKLSTSTSPSDGNKQLDNAISQLDPIDQVLLKLRYVQKMTVPAIRGVIARDYGKSWTDANIHRRLKKARTLLGENVSLLENYRPQTLEEALLIIMSEYNGWAHNSRLKSLGGKKDLSRIDHWIEELLTFPEELTEDKLEVFKRIMYLASFHNHIKPSDLVNLLLKKRHDYGHLSLMRFGVYGILVRMTDKVWRLHNLLTVAPRNESVEDSWIDIMGYSTLVLLIGRGWITLPIR